MPATPSADLSAVARGDIWIVVFGEALGGEVQKTRPAVVISNNYANAVLNRVQIVPTSRTVERTYPSEVLIKVGDEFSKAMADQISTASKRRLLRRIGAVSEDDMIEIERVVKMQLGLTR